jgi:hypothetical protein
MVIVNFLAALLWIGMLLGFVFAVFWVIVTIVFVRGFNRWVHGDGTKEIEEAEDRSAVRRLLDDA